MVCAGQFEFRPRWGTTSATLVVFLLLSSLGSWQLDRADQKEAILQQYEERFEKEPVHLNRERQRRFEKDNMLWHRAVIRGSYSAQYHFLLDNQVLGAQTGYFVYTPFRLDAEPLWVLINRGWVSAGPDRRQVPRVETPEGVLEIQGMLREPFRSGLLLGEDRFERISTTSQRVQRLDIERIADYTGLTFLPYIVRLDTNEPYGFKREWRMPGSGKERHLGYAFQWFALAAALLVIYFAVNTNRITRSIENDDGTSSQ